MSIGICSIDIIMRGLSIQLHKTRCSNELTIAPSLKIVNDWEYYINYICNIWNHISKRYIISKLQNQQFSIYWITFHTKKDNWISFNHETMLSRYNINTFIRVKFHWRIVSLLAFRLLLLRYWLFLKTQDKGTNWVNMVKLTYILEIQK